MPLILARHWIRVGRGFADLRVAVLACGEPFPALEPLSSQKARGLRYWYYREFQDR